MAINDRVRIGIGNVQVIDAVVPVYDLQKTQTGDILFDGGVATPVFAGGVKGNTTGTVIGNPVKVIKNNLKGFDTGAVLGIDYVNLFPVMLDQYQKIGWFPVEHIHVTMGKLT